MNAKWGWIARLGVLLMLLIVGCRTTQPDLKPAKQPEVFNPPSEHANLGGYPKKAFDNGDELAKRSGLDPGGLNQTRGTGMTPAANFGGPGGGGPSMR